MAENKYLGFTSLTVYDERIKDVISAGDTTTLQSAKKYADSLAPNYDAAGSAATIQSRLDEEIARAKDAEKVNADNLTSHTSNTSNPHSVTKSQVGLENVENKSSATIREELTKENVTTALGYTPPTTDTTYSVVSTTADGLAPKRDGSTTKFLRGDGTWAVPPDTNTTYSLNSFGITVTATELNYCDGVTSNIQTQLNGKAASSHTHSYLSLTGGVLTGNLGLGANSLIVGGATLSYNQTSNILDIAKTSGNTASAIGVKLGTKTVGSATQPIYFNAGTPTACTYTLGKSVPSDAKFTDTTYTSLKNPYSLTVKGNGTQSFTYDGSGAKTLNIKAGTNVSVSSDTSGNITINSSMPSHQHTGLVKGDYTAILTDNGNFRLNEITTAADTGTIGTTDIPWRAGYFSEGVYSKGNRIPDFAYGNQAATSVAALSYADVTITFPFTFSTAPSISLTLVSTSTAGQIGQITAAVYSISTTNCVVRLFNGGSSARTPGFHWIASGTKA